MATSVNDMNWQMYGEQHQWNGTFLFCFGYW